MLIFQRSRIAMYPAILLAICLTFAAGLAQGSKPASAPASKPASEDVVKEEEMLAITGGDVETVTMGRLKGATILTKGSKIWKVGRNIEIPAKAKRIDASGMWVYPGLVTPRATGLGVAGFGGGGSRVTDRFDPFASEVMAALAAGITTAYQSDTVMKMLTKGVDGVLVREGGTVRLSVGNGVQKYETRERFERARKYLFELREYESRKATDKTAKEPKRDGVDETTLKLLRREVVARFEVDRASDMMQILQFLDEFRFDCVFSGALEAWTIPSELSRRGVKIILAPRRREVSDPRRDVPTGSSPEAAAILARAGIEFSFYPPPGFVGGDNISFDGIAGRDLLTYTMEGAFAIRGGLDEQRALEAITISAARILGAEDRVGSIEPGKDADLIITDGPIFDFRTFTQTTIVNGVVQYEKSKSHLFAHIRPRTKPPGEVPAYPEKISSEGEAPAEK